MDRERPPRSKIEEVKERDNYRCQNCGQRGGDRDNIEVHAHHVVPLENGGSNKMSNLHTLCEDCHDAVHTDKMAPTADSTLEGELTENEAIRSLAFAIVANRHLVIYALLLIAGVEIVVGFLTDTPIAILTGVLAIPCVLVFRHFLVVKPARAE
jgi:hypothetical protein